MDVCMYIPNTYISNANSLECVPGWKCSDNTRLDPREQSECCEGFMPRPVANQYTPQHPFHLYFIPEETQPDGCPVAMADTLLECLQIHGLSEFLNLTQLANLSSLFSNEDSKITIFAPSNEALRGVGIICDPIHTEGTEQTTCNLTSMDRETAKNFVLSHVIDEEVPEDRLFHSSQFQTLADNTLYVTLVEHYYYRPLLYQTQYTVNNPYYYNSNPYSYNNYWYHQSDYVLLDTDNFISGSKIILPDSCMINNGVLHLINAPVPMANLTVTDILSQRSNLSIFYTALETLDIPKFLDASKSPHTIFAPTNAAFDDFGMELLECLLRFDRDSINDLLLYHIVEGLEYLSSLALRNWIFTNLRIHLPIKTGNNGEVLLGSSEIPITVPNIPATDGVVHIINELLFPPHFDYGECESFVSSGMRPLLLYQGIRK